MPATSAAGLSGLRVGYESMLAGPAPTGVGVAISELLTALAEAAPEVRFVAFTRPCALACLTARPNITPIPSRLAGVNRGARIAWQQVWSARAAQRQDLDLYHGPGYIVAANMRVPAVVTVYDTIALERPELTTRANAAYYRWALPRGVRHARRVVVPSGHVRDRLTACLGLSPARVRVIPLGVGRAFRPLPRPDVERTLQAFRRIVPEEQPFFLCVGNVERKKNLGTVVEAFGRLEGKCRSSALVLAGRAGPEYRTLRERVRRSGLEGRVHFTGYAPPELLVALYNAATAVLYPSLEEGFGLPPLEAMACGTPAVTSNAGALPEVVGGAGILLPADDPAAWTGTMRRLLESADCRQELREQGLSRAAGFGWRTAAERVLEVYREAIEG